MKPSKKMKSKHSLFFALYLSGLGIAFASTAMGAGGISDGGGSAVVCMNRAGKIASAEMLDLYEARNQFGLNALPVPESDATKAALKAYERIEKGEFDRSKMGSGMIPEIAKNMHFLPLGIGLKPVNDIENLIVPKNCGIYQAAVYRDDTGEIYVDKEIYEKFDTANKAALLVHEALYWNLRQYKETNSVRARRAVGLAFAGVDLEPVEEPVGAPENAMACETESRTSLGLPLYQFRAYKAGEHIHLQFGFFDGKLMLTRSIGTLNSGSPGGFDWWPKSRYDFFYFGKLTSLVDNKRGFLIKINKGDTISGSIDAVPMGAFVNSESFGHSFRCKAAQ